MKTRNRLLLSLLLVGAACTAVVAQPGNFATSLHATRPGKNYWYGQAKGGFEALTGVGIGELGCTSCHGPTDANGAAYSEPYQASCSDCHASADFANVQESQCYGCHSRQATEATKLGYTDVHRSAGMQCWDCHNTQDLHGDGTQYSSMLEPGAMKVDCENCHAPSSLPAEHADYNPHGGKLHCTACHGKSVVSCYNCHFESQVEAHVKRAKQPIHDFVLLVNRIKDNKVHPASFQSLSYEGKGFVAFGPYTPHTITSEGRVCADCHVNFGGQNAAISEYNETGQIRFAWLNEDGSLGWLHGIVPMPEDYQRTFRMEFITFNGDPSTPAGQDNNNWSSLGKDTWDGSQMFFATPLTRAQMEKLGFAEEPTAVEAEAAALPTVSALQQNYPNPFNGSTAIPYRLAGTGAVRLEIFDLSGQRVNTLVDAVQGAGEYQVWWDGADAQGRPVATGAYLVRMQAGQAAQVRKVIFAK
ncbi:MAG: T9SS type A sorting domain-containing protein [Candidatus Latescibacteria bacterium]|nr:T9SS type A sorting domain-containing protein [Candidatus Latescibacterota bacterium]